MALALLFWAGPLPAPDDKPAPVPDPARPREEQFEAVDINDDSQANVDYFRRQFRDALGTPADDITIENHSGIFVRTLLMGQNRALYRDISGMMNRLGIEGDSGSFQVRISASPYVNASMQGDKMSLNMGLLAYVRNADELAAVTAHEMTHANRTQLERRSENRDVDEFLRRFPELAKYGQDSRFIEELRADLGAVDRLIKGRYNPWAYFDILERMAKDEASIDSTWYNRLVPLDRPGMADKTHPSWAIRLPAVKAWIAHRRQQLGLTAEETKYTPLTGATRHVARAAKQYVALSLVNKWPRRAVGAGLLLAAAHAAGLTDPETLGNILSSVNPSQAWEHVKEAFVSDKGPRRPATYEGPGAFSRFMDNHGMHLVYGGASLAAGLGYLMLRYAADKAENVDSLQSLNQTRGDLRRQVPQLLRRIQTNPEVIQKDNHEKNEISLGNAIRSNLYILNSVGEIMRTGYGTKWLRYIDGLNKSWRVALSYQRKLLDAAELQLGRLGDGDAAKLRAEIKDAMNLFPGWVLEQYPDILAKVRTVLKLDDQGIADYRDFQKLLNRRTSVPIERLAHLLHLAGIVNERTHPRDILKMAEKLIELGAYDTADRIMKAHYSRVHQFVTAGNHKEEKLVEALVNVQTELAKRGSRHSKGWWAREDYGRRMMRELARARKSNLADHVAAACLSFQCAPIQAFVPALRIWANRAEHGLLQKAIGENFSSLQELTTFLKDEISKRHLYWDQVKEDFYKAILAHPEWVQTIDDVKAMVELEQYWPLYKPEETTSNRPFNERDLAYQLREELKKMQRKFPDAWKYEPGAAEKLHAMAVRQLRQGGVYPDSYAAKLELWKLLTQRGVTSTSDALFAEMYDIATATERAELQALSKDGKIWEAELNYRIGLDEIRESPVYKDLLRVTEPARRMRRLKAEQDTHQYEGLVRLIKRRHPHRGHLYAQTLEIMSWEINSSPEEAEYLEGLKTGGGGSGEELGVRMLSDILDEAHKWSKAEQWKLVLFLRGEGPAPERIERDFRSIGTERLQRAWSVLPIAARTGVLDGFLNNPKGLLPQVNAGTGWAKTVIDHLLKKGTPEAQRIGREVLEAFLYALGATNAGPLKSTTLAYLLAVPPGEGNVGETLKNVFEFFGNTGVKIGQFLAAAEILPEEETKYLRELQEHASPPRRVDVHRDMKSLAPGHTVTIDSLAGAASMKYAIRARLDGEQAITILKVLRERAITDSGNQFEQLNKMAEYLRKKHGAKYGVFAAIIHASHQAVKRELSLPGEVRRAKEAADHIYKDTSTNEVTVKVPVEKLIGRSDRLISSELAPGTSVRDLPGDLQVLAARHILKMEGDNLFADKDVIYFDPDRHPGNYRVEGVKGGEVKLKLGPIDFGQVLSITRKQRDQALEMFTLSQILRESGANDWGAEKLIEIMGLDKELHGKIRKALGAYFPDRKVSEVSAYYALLAALHDVGQSPDIVYFDFVRAVVQLGQYEKLAGDSPPELPRKRLEAQVRARVEPQKENLRLTVLEKVRYMCRSVLGGY